MSESLPYVCSVKDRSENNSERENRKSVVVCGFLCFFFQFDPVNSQWEGNYLQSTVLSNYNQSRCDIWPTI